MPLSQYRDVGSKIVDMDKMCNSCGGIIGRDCFNPSECEMISLMTEHEYNERVRIAQNSQVDDHYNLQYLFQLHEKLVKSLEKQGIDLSEYRKEISDDLPF